MASPVDDPSHSAWWCQDRSLFLGLGLLIFIFYANSFSAGLTADNLVIIAQDSRLQAADWTHVQIIFTTNYWWPLASDLYRPITTLSYWFNYAVLGNGQHVAGYHFLNFLLHWANACLVLLIVRRLSARLDIAALTAALWAVEPVNTEAVTNIVGRADLLATLAILAGGWCYLQMTAVRGWKKIPWLAGLAITSCLGVLAKENAVMICAFLLLYDVLWRWPRFPGNTWGARLAAGTRDLDLLAYSAVAPALLLLDSLRYWLLHNAPLLGESFVNNPIVAATPFQGFMTASGVIGRYLALLVFPHTLSSDYSYHQIPLFGEPGHHDADLIAWVSLAVIVAALAAAFWVRRRQPLLAWGILFFFVMLLPTANLFLNIGSIMAERFLYLPSIGFCTVAALALRAAGAALARRATAWPHPWPIGIAWALPALAIIAFGLRTSLRNEDWQDNFSLWQSAVAASPASMKSHKGLASALWDDGPQDEASLDAAIAEAETGRAILDQTPIPPPFRDPEMYYDLGVYYRLKGKFLADRKQPDDARTYYEKALEVLLRAKEIDRSMNQAARADLLSRGVPPAEITDVGSFHIYIQLGLVFSLLKDWTDCAGAADWALHLAPGESDGYLLAGTALLRSGDPSDAAVLFLAATMLVPQNNEAWTGLVECYKTLGLQPFPIIQKGANFSLYETSPLVRRQINTAGAGLVKAFEQVRLFDAARALRTRLSHVYGIPPDAFSPPPS
jgi:tetratricopeptide (TPR) repeat protein